MIELLLLVLGAVLGVVVDRMSRVGHKKITETRDNSRARKRVQGSDANAVSAWLLDYYHAADLYHCTISGESKAVPFFVQPGWIYSAPLTAAPERLVEAQTAEGSAFRVDDQLIALRRSEGQRLFNNLTYYTYGISRSGSGAIQLEIAQTEYFCVITNLIALEEEVFRSVVSGKRRVPVRDAYLRDAAHATELRLRPLSFGVNVGFVLKSAANLEILIQTRSKLTVTYGGSKALFPTFGLAPIGQERMPADELLYTNFIKEYLEEFYGYDELIDNLSQRRTDPLWFMDLPEATELNRARADGSLLITILGFGMDSLSGTTTMALLVELSNEELARRIINRVTGNWEVAEPAMFTPSLELIDLFSDKLGAYLSDNQLHTGSAFTLDRIQRHYRASETQ